MPAHRAAALLAAVLALAACAREPSPILGTLEWDRIGVAAEASEPIVAIAAREGDQVAAGQLLLELDPRRTQSRLAQAQAEAQRLAAQLAALVEGPRRESIASARAELGRAQTEAANAQRERNRAAELRERGLIAQADFDRADTTLRSANAQAAALRARLLELTNGTRPEDIAQAEAALAAAQARVEELSLTLQRLSVRAPQAGRVDALPFKLGDQPPQGATLVSMLTGTAPYARLFVPEPQRVGLAPGARLRVEIEGYADDYHAVVRNIRSEPAFTPYYALAGDDAARLSYRAEAVLEGPSAPELPAGLPLRAWIDGDDGERR